MMLSIPKVWAVEQVWCVYDPIGRQGDITRRLDDLRLYAQKFNAKIKLNVFQNEKLAIDGFEKKKCSGLAATNFHTFRYNKFMGSTVGIGLIPNNRITRNFLQILNHPNVEKRMIGNEYEAIGMLPIGPAYMMVQANQVSKLAHIKTKRIGILESDPPQKSLVQSVGGIPVYIDFQSAIDDYKQRKIDILAVPAYGLLAYNFKKDFGENSKIINFPMTYFSINLIVRPKEYPPRFGHHIRAWFVQNSQNLTNQAMQWENRLPAYAWQDISIYDRQSYDVFVSRVRNQYIRSGYYDLYFVELMKRLRCIDEPRYFECNIR